MASVASLSAVAACTGQVDVAGAGGGAACPPPNPGMCAPSVVCEGGVARTGQASCVNGQWACAVEACGPDGGCAGATLSACEAGKIVTSCCPAGAKCSPPASYCDLGGGACALGSCADAGCSAGSIQASGYDQSCNADADCAAVFEGNLCGLCFCPNAALAKSALAKYESDFAAKMPPANACDCPLSPPPLCKAGVCALN